jgi:SPP1 gp7 family putative phage head morphogenesis protein
MVGNILERNPDNARAGEMRRDLELTIATALRDFQGELIQDLSEFSQDELDFMASVVNANSKILLTVPSYETVKDTIINSAMDVNLARSRLTIGQAIEQFSIGQAEEIRKVLFEGYATGQSNQDISRSLRKLVKTRPKQQIETLARTAVNHTGSQTRRAYVDQYKDIFDGEEYVAVLDSRTTMQCAGFDGNIYDIGKGPVPPVHWNCRSLRIPKIRDDYASRSQPSTRQNFDQWLKNQDSAFQDEYFSQFPDGAKKAKLFRNSELTIEQFRDGDGREYTLKELRNLHTMAFDKSGVEL